MVVSYATVVKGDVPAKHTETIKVVGFDMDDTIIKTKSGATFAKSY